MKHKFINTNQPRHYRIEKKSILEKLSLWATPIALIATLWQASLSRDANEKTEKSLKYSVHRDSISDKNEQQNYIAQKAVSDSTIAALKRQADAAFLTAESSKKNTDLSSQSLTAQIAQFKLLNEPILILQSIIDLKLNLGKSAFLKYEVVNIGGIPVTAEKEAMLFTYISIDALNNFNHNPLGFFDTNKLLPSKISYFPPKKPVIISHTDNYINGFVTQDLLDSVVSNKLVPIVYFKMIYSLNDSTQKASIAIIYLSQRQIDGGITFDLNFVYKKNYYLNKPRK